jgi:hypothetical protein
MTSLVITLLALIVPQSPTLLLPEGNEAWTVQVTTSGGILGTGDVILHCRPPGDSFAATNRVARKRLMFQIFNH